MSCVLWGVTWDLANLAGEAHKQVLHCCPCCAGWAVHRIPPFVHGLWGVFAKDLAGIVRWERSGLLRGVAGGTFAACQSELLFTLVLRGLVEKGILRHSGKRPPSECTICFTSCVLGPSCGVSPHVFQKGRTIEVLVWSQTRLGQYMIFHHQGSANTCKMTCVLFYYPLCLVESNYRAPPPPPPGWENGGQHFDGLENWSRYFVDRVLGRSCLISLGTIFSVTMKANNVH